MSQANRKDRAVVITGGSSGIGLEAAVKFAKQDWHVVIGCRDAAKGAAAVKYVLSQAKRPVSVETIPLDLASLQSVRGFTAQVISRGLPLKCLVNNAASYSTTFQRSVEDFELTFATNHLGPFLLTNLLLPELKKNAPSNVVVVASSIHESDPTNPLLQTDLESLKRRLLLDATPYDSHTAYRASKLANVLFTYHLARLLEGSGVSVNCLCPGFIPYTGLFRELGFFKRMFMSWFLYFMVPACRSVDHGANCILHAATLSTSGGYYRDMKSSASSEESQSTEKMEQLWSSSCVLTNFTNH